MSLVPTREDEAFAAGYRQASEAGGRVIDHFSKRLTEVEVQRDALVKALQKIADLVDSEAGEPLDDAIEIANKALISVGRMSHD